jgi:hypothetical protein
MLRNTRIVIFILAILLAGCGITPKERITKHDEILIIQALPGERMVIIKTDSDAYHRFCTPVNSDVAYTESQSVGVKHSGENIGESSNEGVVSLGGRDAAVLILRELTYRACELSNNINANIKESKSIYSQFLKTAEKIIANIGGKNGDKARDFPPKETKNLIGNTEEDKEAGAKQGTEEDTEQGTEENTEEDTEQDTEEDTEQGTDD